MGQFFLFFIFISLAGMAIGTLATVKIWYSLPVFLMVAGAVCFISFWFGIITGAAFFSWLPVFFTKFFIILFCLGLAFFFFRQFHPSYGYFPYRGWLHWVLLAAFFFIIGIDFAIIGFSAWFLFLFLPVFAGMLFLGALLMWKLKMLFRLGAVLIYVPLFFFIFLALFKLV
ncbi:hypothetical protein [Evansella clarkii]|jgi:hypothetical protein|uniref:hypothetical protein n=1 Tax=Evansella clarkii TaxID=79879 RepID=UPI0009966633|nr:hypothetical protein [Evansella clarkii]